MFNYRDADRRDLGTKLKRARIVEPGRTTSMTMPTSLITLGQATTASSTDLDPSTPATPTSPSPPSTSRASPSFGVCSRFPGFSPCGPSSAAYDTSRRARSLNIVVRLCPLSTSTHAPSPPISSSQPPHMPFSPSATPQLPLHPCDVPPHAGPFDRHTSVRSTRLLSPEDCLAPRPRATRTPNLADRFVSPRPQGASSRVVGVRVGLAVLSWRPWLISPCRTDHLPGRPSASPPSTRSLSSAPGSPTFRCPHSPSFPSVQSQHSQSACATPLRPYPRLRRRPPPRGGGANVVWPLWPHLAMAARICVVSS
ncbi:hypothetical protein JB92DRAFT_3052907 [Gautieria morchelliformis]|nr:hypothetical protein JB92DRAFT_3052907 [Gautieria morchelliformis]